jgi:choice-of-anchor C domain-containing protein
VQWNADDVLDATNALTYSITSQTVAGAFAINSDSGVVTVANGSLLNFESQTSHTLTVRVTDGSGATFDKAFTVAVNNLTESNTAPSDLSAGVKLNTDGGNNAYLRSTSGGSVFGGLTALTLEVNYTMASIPASESPLVSYAVAGTDNEVYLRIMPSGTLSLAINGTVSSTSSPSAQLVDGKQHAVAVSWDNTNGDVRFYIDGQLVQTNTGLKVGTTLQGGGTLVIGQDQDSVDGGYNSTQVFSGTMHDIRVWNRAISDEQISQNYQQKLTDIPTGLVANWRMTGIASGTSVVESVAGVNLTIANVAVGGGFTTSTPTTSLTIAENAANGTTVGSVVVSEANNTRDIVADGLFREAANPGSVANYTTGQSFGNWTVQSGDVDLVGTLWQASPLGGRSVDLNGNNPGAIAQTLTTVAGRQYQVIFNATGNWLSGDATKDFRVSAGGTSQDYSLAQPSGWSTSNMLFSGRSMTFTATSSSTTLAFQSLDTGNGSGPVIADVRVMEIPAAVSTILNNDPTLSYDAGTGKFYRLVNSSVTWAAAQSAAVAASLNGVSGNLVTIGSSYEQDLVWNLNRNATASSGIWLGASDQAAEGTWKWYSGSTAGTTFWVGASGGTLQAGQYAYWTTGEPNDSSGSEEWAVMDRSTGMWNDLSAGWTQPYVIEWDASEVLSNFTYSLTSNPGGAFAINSSTGEITVANSSQLDYEAATTKSMTVQVTDASGNTYSEAFTINLTAVNDNTPIITSNGGGATASINVAEGSTAVTTITATDADVPAQTLTYSIVGGADSSFFSISSTTGSLSFISGRNFESPADSGANNVYDVIVRVDDGMLWDDQSIAVTITNVNEAPVLSPYSPTLPLTEDTAPYANTVAALLGASVADADIGAVEGIAITSISGSIGALEYSLDGTTWTTVGSVTTTSALLLRDTDLLRFSPNGQNGGTLSITYRAWDQTSGTAGTNANTTTNGGTTAFSSASDTVTVTASSVNDAPVLGYTGMIGLPATNEDTTSSATLVSDILLSGIRSDVDSSAVSGLAVTSVSANGTFQYSTDGVTWTNFGAVSSSNALLLTSTSQVRFVPNGSNGESATFNFRAWDQTSGTASINGTPGYANPGAGGGTTAYSSQSATVQITVTSVNDAPVLDNTGTMTLTTINEDDTANAGQTIASMILSAGGDRITDVDTSAVEGIAITATTSGNGSWEYSTNGGSSWSLIGTVAGNSALLLRSTDMLRFVPDGQSATTGDITFRAWDQTGATAGQHGTKVDTSANGGTTVFSSATETASITITAVNDTPVVTAPAGPLSATENQWTAIDGVGFSLSDGDAGSGDLLLTLHVTQGYLTIGMGDSGVGIQSGNLTDTVVLTGTVSQLNNLITGASTGFVRYVPDVDVPNATTTLTITVNDQGNTGTDPGLSADGSSEEDAASVLINITAVNDSPTFMDLDGAPTYTEGGSPVVLGSNVTISDPELNAIGHYNGATLRLVRNGGGNSDDALAFDGMNVTASGANVIVGGTTVGTYVFTGGQMDVAFNTNATHARVNTLLQNIIYWNWSDTPPASVQIDWTFSDANSGVQGTGGALTATGSTTVTIVATSDEQVLAINTGATVVENSTGNDYVCHNLRHPATQADIDSGLVTYDHNGTENFADAFSFSVDDGSGTTSTGTFSITITPVNDNDPTITSNGAGSTASISIAENSPRL